MNAAWRATAFGAALYLLVGANLPYLPVWLEEARGFSGWQISAMIAAATLVRIVAGPLIAASAEQGGLGRPLRQLALVSLFAFGALIPETPVGFVAVLVMLTYVVWGALAPLTEALLLAGTKDARPDYGMARAIASSCFIIASLGTGALISRYGTDAVLWWLVGAAGLLVLASLLLPGETKPAETRPSLGMTLREGFGLFRNRRVLMAGLAISLIQSAHAYYYNLGSNVWIGQGVAEVHIGALWSVGVAAEVLLLLASGRLFGRWTPGALILLGGGGAVLRWSIMGFAPPLAGLYVLQSLHAFSFAATHIGILRFLAEEVPADKIPVAMTINSAVIYGPMLAVFGILAGFWYDYVPSVQAGGYWLMAGFAALGCVCALSVVRRVQPQSSEPGGLT